MTNSMSYHHQMRRRLSMLMCLACFLLNTLDVTQGFRPLSSLSVSTRKYSKIIKNVINKKSPEVGNVKILSTELHCIDKTFRALEPVEIDADDNWRTKPSTIICIDKEPMRARPEVITFDAMGTLITPSQSVGRWYREALNSVCEMRARLPRPALFTNAFNKAYADMSKSAPCFGAVSGMSSREWWYAVVRNTYLTTQDMTLDKEELESLLPEVFNFLYDDIFGTKEGWTVKENVEYVLKKLSEWRDQGAGPKLGVVSNFDERLSHILKDLELSQYFDFVVTSHEAKNEKPNRDLFDRAFALAKCKDVNGAYHIGDSLEQDIFGAGAAGWSPMRFKEWFDEDFPDWTVYDTPETAAQGVERHAAFMKYGRKDTVTGIEWIDLWSFADVLSIFGFPEDSSRPIATTYVRAVLDD